MRPRPLTAAIVIVIAAMAAAVPDPLRADDRAPFVVTIDNDPVPWNTMSVTLLPRATLRIGVEDPATDVEASSGELVRFSPRRWRWIAPATPGDARIEITRAGGDRVRLQVFVLVPRATVRRGFIKDFRIGDYPARPLKGNPIYRPPEGFIEVTRQNADTKVSPHFRLEQFLVKQHSDYPKYLVLQTPLLVKLEYILARVREAGHKVNTLVVMSGYRTPFYNRAIGNTTTFSHHEWGRAADIFVDEDRDGVMDDLNRDGQIDETDAQVLKAWVQQVDDETRMAGGLGAYPGTRAHGPFVHVDVRGTAARW